MDSNEEYLDQLLKSLMQEEDSASDAEQPEPEAASPSEDLPVEISEDSDSDDLREESAPSPDLDAALSMSQDEIEQLLAANKQEPEEKDTLRSDMEQEDLSSFIANLGEDSGEDVQEISELLSRAEHDEPVDDTLEALLQDLKKEEAPDKTYSAEDLFGAEEREQSPEMPERRKKKERVKKEKKPRRSRRGQKTSEEDAPAATEDAIGAVSDIADLGITTEETHPAAEPVRDKKKPSFWKKLVDALTEEEEEEIQPVSDENEAILQQMEQEDRARAGISSQKKKKADKKKKGSRAVGPEDDELEDGDKEKKKKEKKSPKAKRPGKEKKEKEKPIFPEEDTPGRKLSMKKVLPILAAALVVVVAYVIISQLYIEYANKQKAADAFYAGDYMECYELLFGQKLNESQAVMYHKSELILKMERAKKNYQTLLLEGKELEALDYLVQFLCRYEEYRLEGQEWNSLDVVEETYTGMAGLLTANYGLTQVQAMEIAALEKDEDYTLALLTVLEGDYGQDAEADNQPGEQPFDYEELLPEELENQDAVFIDTLE